MQVDTYMESDLMQSLKIYRDSSQDGNKTIKDDFDAVQHLVNECNQPKAFCFCSVLKAIFVVSKQKSHMC